ncbi:hypothetical protein HUT18_33080 [Streptomyces sp. NA04227]|nr:hypothetical protein [Streptomyces sp. NA04227]QKW10535.1 hypothetical protein HUT18_33080 [Streptomyces sp. NA04227]
MVQWVWAGLVPVGVLGVGAGVFWVWARMGTDRPVEHHSSMPTEYVPPEG